MSNWDELVAKDSPREEEIKQQKELEKEHENRYKQYFLYDYEWDLYVNGKIEAWNYECQRMYAILGIKVAKKDVLTYERSAGPTVIKQTATGTYELRDTTNIKKTYGYTLEVDTTKIIDIEKYDKIKKNVDDFLYEAKKKFKAPTIGEEPVVPAYFNHEEIYNLKFKDEYKKLPRLFKAIFYPLYQAGVKKFYETYTTKYEKYIPLANAYFEQVKAFEEEIKKIANFD